MSIRFLQALTRKVKEQKKIEEAEEFSLEELEEQMKQAERNVTVLQNKTRMNSSAKEQSLKYWYTKLEELRIIKELKLKLESEKQSKDNSVQTKEG